MVAKTRKPRVEPAAQPAFEEPEVIISPARPADTMPGYTMLRILLSDDAGPGLGAEEPDSIR